jgi:hypothetical protein
MQNFQIIENTLFDISAVLEKYIEVILKKPVRRWIQISAKLLKIKKFENFTQICVSFG